MQNLPPPVIFTPETINFLLKYEKIKHNPIMQNLGKTIQKLRKEKRLSQTELAHLSNVPSQSKISSWENDTCIPDVWEAQKLAQIFGVSLEEFLSES